MTFTFTARLVVDYEPADGDIVNTAEVTATTTDPEPGNNAASATLAADDVADATADVWIDKSVDLSSLEDTHPDEDYPVVAPGNTFVYVLTVGNDGPSLARGIQVADLLPTELAFVASDVCTGEAESYGAEVLCDVGELAPGATTPVTIEVRLDPTYLGDGSDITNTATVTTLAEDPNPENNSDSSTVPAGQPYADLSVTKTAVGTDPPTPGETFDFELTIANDGPSAARGISVTDTLPAELAFVSAEECTGDGSYGGTVECPAPEVLLPGDELSYTLTVRLDPAYLGDGTEILNTARVDAETEDFVSLNNRDTEGLPSGGAAAPSADLALAKSFADTPVAPGGVTQITLTVENAGPSVARNIVLTDALPGELAFAAGAECTGTVGGYGGTVTCPAIAELAVGDTVTRTFDVRLHPAYTGDGSDVEYTATVTATTADPEPGNNTASATLDAVVAEPEVNLDVDTSITTPGGLPIAPGEGVDVTVTVGNDGPSTARDVTVAIPVPEGMTVDESGLPDTCTVSDDGRTVTCVVDEIPPGASANVTVPMIVDPDYTGDGSDLVITPVVTAPGTDPVTGEPTDLEGIVGDPEADLALTKNVGQAGVAPGETFGYQLTVTNDGPSDAVAVVITDALPATLMFVAADGCAGDEEYGATVSCEIGTLAAGDTETIEITVRLDPGYTGTGEDIVNMAVVTSDTHDPDERNNTASAPLGVDRVAEPSADLALTKAFDLADGEQIAPGDTASVRFTVTNDGPSHATGVVVTDRLPAELAFVSSDDCAGPTGYGGTVTCEIGDLAVGEMVELLLTVRLHPAYDGDGSDVENNASVTAQTDDPDPFNNAAFDTLGGAVSGLEADLILDKSVDLETVPTGEVIPGETFDFLLTVTNAGPSDASGVIITDQLPAELEFVSAAECTGQTAAGVVVTCTIGDLPVGEVVEVAFTARLAADYSGDGSDVINVAEVTATTVDPDETNNSDETSVPAGQPHADLEIAKAADGTELVAPGEEFGYTITIVNHGPAASEGVVVTDSLPEQLALVSAEGCVGETGVYGAEIVCELGTLQLDQTETIELTVILDPAYPGTGEEIVNTAVVDADTPDLYTPNNTATAGVPGGQTAPPSAAVELTKTTTASAVAPGETFDYVLTVTNNGPSVARDVVLTDELPSQVSYVAADAPVSVSGQTVTAELGTLTVEETVTVTITVLLDPSYRGDGSDIVNTASVDSSTPNPFPDGGTDAVDLGDGGVGEPVSDLTIIAHDADGPVTPGSPTRMTYEVTNLGPSATADVTTVELTMPEFVLAAETGQPDNCAVSGDRLTVTCEITDVIEPASAQADAFGLAAVQPMQLNADGSTYTQEIALRVTADAPAPATLTGGVGIVRNVDDTVPANNTDPWVATTIEGEPTPTPTPTPTPDPTTPPARAPGGLPLTGAALGGVLIGLAVALVLAGVMLVTVRRRTRTKETEG